LATAAETGFKTLNATGRREVEKRLLDLKADLDGLKNRAECELGLWTRVASQREKDLESLRRNAALLKTINEETHDEASYALLAVFPYKTLLRAENLF
uniref:MT domain-containing protein n=1 Tax=Schistocephalus solidus TaxID=70667 RepID=A0A183S9H5_SCHSO